MLVRCHKSFSLGVALALFAWCPPATALTNAPAASIGAPKVQGETPAAAADSERLSRLLDAPLRPTPLEARVWRDAADGSLDEHSLVTAALVAGGLDDAETVAALHRRFDSLAAELKPRLRRGDSPRHRAAVVLDFMHGRVFTAGYKLEATALSRVLQTGEFNCVSAATLFLAFAEEVGLDAHAITLPAHALCRVEGDDAAFDVETTCRTWFSVIDDPAARQAVLKRVAGASADNLTARRLLSHTELLGIIYYNRGVELLGRREYAAAITANLCALRLDAANPNAPRNLWAAVNNGSLELCRGGHYAAAAALVARGRLGAPWHPALKTNEAYIREQWGIALCRQRQYAEAVERIRESSRLASTAAPPQTNTLRDVYDRWLSDLVAEGQRSEALRVLSAAEADVPHESLWTTWRGRL